MSNINRILDSLQLVFANRAVLATVTLAGMVLAVLGAFYVVDAVRLPPKLGRTGMPLLPEFDEVVVVRGIPWQPIGRARSWGSRVIGGIVTGIVVAASFSIVVGIGYRHGVVGGIAGAALGLGLGLAVALRPAMRWLASRAGLSLFFVGLRFTVNIVSYWIGILVLIVLAVPLFLIAYILFVAIWLVLLPWMLFVLVVRKVRQQPLHPEGLLAPLAFLFAANRASVAEARQARVWRDPENKTASARGARWVVGITPKTQKYSLAVIIGNLYGIGGRVILGGALDASSVWPLLLGALVVFGFAVERIDEVVVASLFVDDFAAFVDYGSATLNGLRVGLVTGLSLGTVLGLGTGWSTFAHSILGLLRNFAPENLAAVTMIGVFSLLAWLLPNLLGLVPTPFAEWVTDRVRSYRAGVAIGGIILLLAGTALQMLQFVITVR